MTKYTKNGSYPVGVQDLPAFDVDDTGKIYTHLAVNADSRTATGWEVAPPEPIFDPETEKLVWNDVDWEIVDLSSLPALPQPVLAVTHKELLDLLTISEQIKFKAMRKFVDALSATDFVLPQNLLYQLFSVTMDQFDKSTNIQLTHAQTIAAFNSVFVPLNIITAPRAAQVLSRIPPQ